MLRSVLVRNYKSALKLNVPLSRFTVIVGENGCGKSNLLEALAFLSAAAEDRLEPDLLWAKGIRVSEAKMLLSAFPAIDDAQLKGAFSVEATFFNRKKFKAVLEREGGEFGRWINVEKREVVTKVAKQFDNKLAEVLRVMVEDGVGDKVVNIEEASSVLFGLRRTGFTNEYVAKNFYFKEGSDLAGFRIYSPSVPALRGETSVSRTQPVGINGEGLYVLFRSLVGTERFADVEIALELIGWYDSIACKPGPTVEGRGEPQLSIRDHYLVEGGDIILNEWIVNEGFLVALFLVCLVVSPDTPEFLAIDNIALGLNPKLAAALTNHLAKCAIKYDKQVIVTTHNPAVLDGLDLTSSTQSIVVMSRDIDGKTTARRVSAKRAAAASDGIGLSTAFMRGFLGGLPEGF